MSPQKINKIKELTTINYSNNQKHNNNQQNNNNTNQNNNNNNNQNNHYEENIKKRGTKRSKSPTKNNYNIDNTGIPKTAHLLTTLPHGDIVCSVSIHSTTNRIYTGGKGWLKLWNLSGNFTKPLAELPCLGDKFVRSCKLTNDGSTIIVGGEASSLVIWELNDSSPRMKYRINIPSQACYGISISPDDNYFFSCYGDGSISAWDLSSGKLIRSFLAHSYGVSCMEVSPDGTKLITGGLDSHLRVWDIASGKEIGDYVFPSQIFSLGVCPGESWLAVGLENSLVEVLNLLNTACKYQLHLHESCILSVKFSHSSKWFISTGKDKTMNFWRSPFGNAIFQCKEPNSILCCDISSDDNYIVTGSGAKLASLYEVIY
jgi:groucho